LNTALHLTNYHFSVDAHSDWTVNNTFFVWNYLEFTIGIIAASLPSLKPLFTWFYDSALAFTGKRSKGTDSKISHHKAAGPLGYHKQRSDFSSSIVLQRFTSKSFPRDPYNVTITHPLTGRADMEAWDMMNAKGSDESIKPLQDSQKNQSGIRMTKEFSISQQ
jgi:hypothetical protein